MDEKLERRAVDVIQAITNAQPQLEEEDEAINMCQALEDIKKEGEDVGKEEHAQDVARNLSVRRFDIKDIAQIVGFSPEKA